MTIAPQKQDNCGSLARRDPMNMISATHFNALSGRGLPGSAGSLPGAAGTLQLDTRHE
jgi:hypothetical protein